MDVRSYRDLQVWQKAMLFAEAVYGMTAGFPKEELYGLCSQLRRAVVSVPSNIAEGSSHRSTQEFIRYVNIASGSLAEIETQLMLAGKLQFIQREPLEELLNQSQEISRMLFYLQKSLSEKAAA